MTQETKHTPLPFFAIEDYLDVEGWGVFSRQFNPHDNDCVNFVCQASSKENAAFIAHACNSHYELLDQLKKARAEISALWDFYGRGLEVKGWHLNGDLEPLDTFFEENRNCELSEIDAAIAKAEGAA